MTIQKSNNPYAASDIINGLYLEECHLKSGKKGYLLRRARGLYGSIPVFGTYNNITIKRVYKDFEQARADLLKLANM